MQKRLNCPSSSSSFPIILKKSMPVQLLELKRSCKIETKDMISMKIGLESDKNKKVSSDNAASGSGSSASSQSPVADADAGAANSVYLEDKKKYGKGFRKNYNSEGLSLKVQDVSRSIHLFRGQMQQLNNVQGSFYVMAQSDDGTLEAHPVQDWCAFEPKPKYKPLTEEEAEQEWERRNKVVNHFSVMVQRRMKGEVYEDEDPEKEKATKKVKIACSDLEDEDGGNWIDSESDENNENDT